ncbi:4-alpha-glucanotransferase [Chitinophaga caeni]|uniref:4-alpha-glucanotransferase n=1 Tax=Chitinophaga caeni TaxID=2029983 RepID=A0A291QVL2_9BACT|nr:4-alpha-glucanotransferase [Chitinophaga caeni]ATL47967.1 4-alpha-glucanotransferase [Chitinophaga caeni]
MLIKFYLRFSSKWGQQMLLVGSDPGLGNMNWHYAKTMQYLDENTWYIECNVETLAGEELVYQFALLEQGEILPSGQQFSCRLPGHEKEGMVLLDTWIAPRDFRNTLTKKMFPGILQPREVLSQQEPAKVTLEIIAPLLPAHINVCVLGELQDAIPWDVNHPLMMQHAGNGKYRAYIDKYHPGMQYKYALFDTKEAKLLRYEEGENRKLDLMLPGGMSLSAHDGFIRVPQYPWKGAGIVVPVFSLRTSNASGCGEFLDLIPLGDWAAACGFKLIQVLPVNDTGANLNWKDSYPYAAISVFALHPIYLDLHAVGLLPEDHPLQKDYTATKDRLNQMDSLDYEAVMSFKMQYLRAYFDINMASIVKEPAFLTWLEAQDWLHAYTAFCVLRDQVGDTKFDLWEFRTYREYIDNHGTAYTTGQLFYAFIQYQLHLQLELATKYLHGKGIILKGDIAIGVHPQSADVWTHPELFNRGFQAGAPPDLFAEKGQNWGFPTYNWDEMAKDGYHWWRRRLQLMSSYFDAYRVDHILGFFRIWQIPAKQVEGILGYFSPADAFKYEDFEAANIIFDRKRFCEPYINGKVLTGIFGNAAGQVKKAYLIEQYDGTFQLKPGLSDQRSVLDQFDEGNIPGSLLSGILQLLSNVLFIESVDENGFRYHPRFQLEDTLGFDELDIPTRYKLKQMHDDYYYQRSDATWRRSALLKLPALYHAADMLMCAEDLGMIPKSVTGVLNSLGILRLDIQRMPKNEGQVFANLSESDYLAVVAPGTHDVSVLRAWWKELTPTERARYSRDFLKLTGEVPAELEVNHLDTILQQHLQSPAMWCIFPIQDILAISSKWQFPDPSGERINIPSNAEHYWKYRVHVNLDSLIADKDFQATWQAKLKNVGRL